MTRIGPIPITWTASSAGMKVISALLYSADPKSDFEPHGTIYTPDGEVGWSGPMSELPEQDAIDAIRGRA